jgi:hypothetical protein
MCEKERETETRTRRHNMDIDIHPFWRFKKFAMRRRTHVLKYSRQTSERPMQINNLTSDLAVVGAMMKFKLEK